MVTKTSWHKYGSKLPHCHLMYTNIITLVVISVGIVSFTNSQV